MPIIVFRPTDFLKLGIDIWVGMLPVTVPSMELVYSGSKQHCIVGEQCCVSMFTPYSEVLADTAY